MSHPEMRVAVVGKTRESPDQKLTIPERYLPHIYRNNLLPIVIDGLMSDEEIRHAGHLASGIIFIGGDDINPELYGQTRQAKTDIPDMERDRAEKILFNEVEKGKPFAGICRGAQKLNILKGGTLHQDIIPKQWTKRRNNMTILHGRRNPKVELLYQEKYRHPVHLSKGSLAYRVFRDALTGEGVLNGPNMHHQAVAYAPPTIEVTGVAPDGIKEAFELKDHPFALAVQWHPEADEHQGDLYFRAISYAIIDYLKKAS